MSVVFLTVLYLVIFRGVYNILLTIADVVEKEKRKN